MIVYNVQLDKKVEKFIRKQTSNFIEKFMKKVEMLSYDPYTPFLDIKKLKWVHDTYRLRIWKARFLYTVEHTKILIHFFDADGRGDIYKK